MKVANKTTVVAGASQACEKIVNMEAITPGREEDAGLLETVEEAEQRAEGLHRKIVGWTKGRGGHPMCIAQYGPHHSAKYRSEPISKDALNDPSIPELSIRISEMKKYNIANVKGILGVVLPQTNANKNILDKVDPAKKGEGNRFCPILVKISWDETVQQAEGTCVSFETRSAYNRLYQGSSQAKDEKIYEKAKMQEERYKQWEQGQRRGTESSPSSTPQPVAAVTTESAPVPQTRSETAQPVKTVEQWLRDYALVSGWDPKALTREQKQEAASMLPLEVSRPKNKCP